VRVTVRGNLVDWPEPGPAAHFKIFLPVGPSEQLVPRTYTVRAFDRSRGEVTIDFALHEGGGPAADWAANVRPGARLELSGRARSTFEPAPEGGRYVFACDESALPAVATCLEVLPTSAQATVIAEVADKEEERPVSSPATVNVHWVHRDEGSIRFIDAVSAVVRESNPTEVWIACEANTMRTIRRSLLDNGCPVAMLKTRGYWKRGEAGHTDHDTGDDVI
jgi:NADPH-dependent ferric siderophore reductase